MTKDVQILFAGNTAFVMREAIYFNVYESIFSGPAGLNKFKKLVAEYGIKTVVETGTYKGDSTVALAEFVNQVYSIEINQEYYNEAKRRMVEEWGYKGIFDRNRIALYSKGNRRIVLALGNSPEVISTIISILKKPICFYLDAHWLDYWPIKDEIRAVKPRPNSLIIVHDIEVPGKRFGWDGYYSTSLKWDGPKCKKVKLTHALIKEDLEYVNPDYKISYNDEEEDSPLVRGILYATP